MSEGALTAICVILTVILLIIGATAFGFYTSVGDMRTTTYRARGKCVTLVERSNGWRYRAVDILPCGSSPLTIVGP